MKVSNIQTSLLGAVCAIFLSGNAAFAQDSVVTTSSAVSSDGVVQQFNPTSSQIIVTTSGSTAPVQYNYNKTTTFVDAAGNVVAQESIKQNTSARIYYTKVGDHFVVTKFVVNPVAQTQVVTPITPVTPTVEDTTTTTTTTEKK